jgi:hypothetical protein
MSPVRTRETELITLGDYCSAVDGVTAGSRRERQARLRRSVEEAARSVAPRPGASDTPPRAWCRPRSWLKGGGRFT